jgi:uncharacterized membrane protein YjjB (DUF3815 family)
LEFLKDFIYALISTIGFAILFNIPRDSIIKVGFAGAIGWIMYLITDVNLLSPVAGAFWGSITVGILGEIFARYYKKPATVFIVPGIVPFVPGAGMYYTMLAIIENRFSDAASTGSEAIFIAASIASGIIISSSLSKLFNKGKSISSTLLSKEKHRQTSSKF